MPRTSTNHVTHPFFGLQERRRITLADGKWFTRKRTTPEITHLNRTEGKSHLEPDTSENDLIAMEIAGV